jgi:hypothetical protein
MCACQLAGPRHAPMTAVKAAAPLRNDYWIQEVSCARSRIRYLSREYGVRDQRCP